MGGGAKIVLRKNGEISITANSKIAIKSSGRVFVVAEGEMTLKASKDQRELIIAGWDDGPRTSHHASTRRRSLDKTSISIGASMSDIVLLFRTYSILCHIR